MGRGDWTFVGKGYPDNGSILPLLKFYVFECPVRGVARRGRDFDALGWSGAAFATLKKEMLKSSTLTNDRWGWIGSNDDLEGLLREWGQLEAPSFEFEFAAYKKGNKPEVEGLFYLIRNSLAHGSFFRRTVKATSYYVFENRKGGILKGRAVLRESTLRNWKSIVLNPSKHLNKRKSATTASLVAQSSARKHASNK